ncbi:hypothetical protein D3C71_1539680 [compost metagenome]
MSGRTIIIDADKAIDIQEEEIGSKVFFITSIRGKDGNPVVRSITVKEKVHDIAEILRTAAVEQGPFLHYGNNTSIAV